MRLNEFTELRVMMEPDPSYVDGPGAGGGAPEALRTNSMVPPGRGMYMRPPDM